MKRVLNRLYYFIETLFLSSTVYQFLAVALVILTLSLLAGAIVYFFSPPFQEFSKAVWWAFLRLSDPGYLGEDERLLPRTVSTILTIAGYVVFLGALVAIMTTWLNRFLNYLASGRSPIFEEDHILIIGWNSRIHAIIEEIVHAEERVIKRLHRTRLPAIAILTNEFRPTLFTELKQKLAKEIYQKCRILIRVGNPLEAESLDRVDYQRASSIILISTFEQPERRHLSDISLIKILLSLKAQAKEVGSVALPNVVLEIGNPANKILAETAGWPEKTEAIASNEFISRLMSQAIRHPGLSRVYDHLLTDTFGQSLFLYRIGDLALQGYTLQEAMRCFQQAVPIGILKAQTSQVRQEKRLRLLNLDETMDDDDEIICIASSIRAIAAGCQPHFPDSKHHVSVKKKKREAMSPGVTHPVPSKKEPRCLLLVGWSHLINYVLNELRAYHHESFAITIVSHLAQQEIEKHIRADVYQSSNLQISYHQARLDQPDAVKTLKPETFDNIVLLSSELQGDPLMADAETVMAYVQLERYFHEIVPEKEVSFLVELNDEDNRALFQIGRINDFIMTQEIISHLLSQVAVRRALAWIYEELFTQGGPEIKYRPFGEFFDHNKMQSLSFDDCQVRCIQAGVIAIGYRLNKATETLAVGTYLNPDRDIQFVPSPDDQLIVIEEE